MPRPINPATDRDLGNVNWCIVRLREIRDYLARAPRLNVAPTEIIELLNSVRVTGAIIDKNDEVLERFSVVGPDDPIALAGKVDAIFMRAMSSFGSGIALTDLKVGPAVEIDP
jgi:hypothetical protein